MIPSLFAKRGRAFMLTFATSLMISGPVSTIQYNLQELVRSFTCMYEQIKGLAERFHSLIKDLMKQVKAILEEINEMQKVYKKALEKMLKDATDDQRQQIEKAKKQMKEQGEKVKRAVKGVTDVLNAPGKFLSGVCDVGDQVGSAVAGFFKKDIPGFFKNLFGRRKRSACGIPSVLDIPGIEEPDLNVSDKLKELLKAIKPDLDILNIDMKGMEGKVDASSIKNIREAMKALFNNLMNMFKLIARYWSKIFYLTIILVVVNAVRYQNQYYIDNDFDNKMVDENLTKMWMRNGLRKLTPLRKWEVKKQEAQMATSIKMTRSEIQQMVTQSFPTILAMVVIVGIILVDFAFTLTLQAFEESAKFGIAFPGMEQGISFSSFMEGADADLNILKVEAFNLSTDPCLPRSNQTDASTLVPIFALLFICLISCILDAYFSRLRAQICNLFFPNRADERAKYLYKYT